MLSDAPNPSGANSSRAPAPTGSLSGFLAVDEGALRAGMGMGGVSSDSMARAGGVINSRNSVHRPPKPNAQGSAPQHTDLQVLGMYKNMRRAEAQAGSFPFAEEAAGAATVQAGEDMIRGEPQRPPIGGFDDWCDRTEGQIEGRRRQQRGGKGG